MWVTEPDVYQVPAPEGNEPKIKHEIHSGNNFRQSKRDND